MDIYKNAMIDSTPRPTIIRVSVKNAYATRIALEDDARDAVAVAVVNRGDLAKLIELLQEAQTAQMNAVNN